MSCQNIIKCTQSRFALSDLTRICAHRDPTRDGCIKEFIKRKLSFGLFWAVGAAEKKKLPTAISNATFWGGFLMFSRSKNKFNLFLKIP